MSWKNIIRGLVIPTALAALLCAPASAESKFGLAPAMVVQQFKPGVPFEFDLYVSNGFSTPVLMKSSVQDFWYNDKNEKVFGAPGTLPRSASNWVQFVPPQITVPGEGSGKIKVIITPPADAVGGYYCILFLESKPELTQNVTKDNRAIYTNFRMGSLVMLSAESTEKYKVDVTNPAFVAPAKDHPLSLEFDVQNQGNSHIFPHTEVAILDSNKQLVARTVGDFKRLLPNQKDRFKVSWGGELPPGDYDTILTLVYGDGKIYTQEFAFKVAEPLQ